MQLITGFVGCKQLETIDENLIAFKPSSRADDKRLFTAPVEYGA